MSTLRGNENDICGHIPGNNCLSEIPRATHVAIKGVLNSDLDLTALAVGVALTGSSSGREITQSLSRSSDEK